MKDIKCYSNRELLIELKDVIKKEGIIIKSEVRASEILLKYNYVAKFENSYIKELYKKLRYAAMERNLNVPDEWYDVLCTNKDVIERINEIKNKEIQNYIFNPYIFQTYSGLNRIEYFFQDIINNEFSYNKIIDYDFKKKKKKHLN